MELEQCKFRMHMVLIHPLITDLPSPSLFSLPGKEHLFEVVTPSRTFYVQVESDADMQDWVKAFNDLLKTIRPSQQVRYACTDYYRA